MKKRITIIGCGPGDANYLLPVAQKAIAEADIVLGHERLLQLFSHTNTAPLPAHSQDAIAVVEEHLGKGSVVVLASGDTGLFSITEKLVEHFGAEKCQVFPGISSVQVAFAKLALSWDDARILSAHGRTPEIRAEELATCKKIAILGGTTNAQQWVGSLAAELETTHKLIVCENLTLPKEQIREMKPGQLAEEEFCSLVIFLLIRR